MKTARLATAIVSILVFLFVLLGINSTNAQAPVKNDNSRHPGRVLVKFKDDTSKSNADKEIKKHGAEVVDEIQDIGVLVLNVPAKAEDRVIAALSKNPHVEFAEPDFLAFTTAIPNDPFFTLSQWGLENTGQTINGTIGLFDADIDAPTAWNKTTGGVRIAILDTGIDQNHEDLSSKIVNQRNFTTSPTIDDLYGHGTHVAGIASAITDNGMGIAGGCPDCKLLNGKVLGDNGSGSYSWIANGITWAANNNSKVINLSLGGTSRSSTLEKAVNYAWNKGAVVVGAAGNCGCKQKLYPAAYNKAIAVAATNNKDKKASFSSYNVNWVDVAAPGQDIFSTFPNHPYVINRSLNYDFASGTSMATPITSATVALIWSSPHGTSAASVRSRLESTADKISGTGKFWSAGRINAASAVK